LFLHIATQRLRRSISLRWSLTGGASAAARRRVASRTRMRERDLMMEKVNKLKTDIPQNNNDSLQLSKGEEFRGKTFRGFLWMKVFFFHARDFTLYTYV
jgi:hypothetical protein